MGEREHERANYKGVGIVFARSLLRGLSESDQQKVRDGLTPTDFELLERTTASTWVPLVAVARIFDVVALQAFRGEPDPIVALGAGLARHNLKTVYRAIVRVLGPSTMLAQHSRLWGLYHRDGVAELVERTPTSSVVQVRDHPLMPLTFRVCMGGWIAEAGRLSGAERCWCVVDDSQLPVYRWRVRWRD